MAGDRDVLPAVGRGLENFHHFEQMKCKLARSAMESARADCMGGRGDTHAARNVDDPRYQEVLVELKA